MNKLDIQAVLKHLPHRYPFLLIDRVEDYEINKSLRAIKNVTYNEPQFTGHFPVAPVMPGVLIIEAMAQATGILAFKSMGGTPDENSLYILAGVDKARFKRIVQPGDQLVIDVTVQRVKRGIWVFETVARVDGEIAASAEIMCTERKVAE